MLSLLRYTLSISLALLAVTSAAPQSLAYGSSSDLSYASGDTGTDCSGPDCLPTQIPISPITIASDTDFLPISNIQPIVNVFPPNINDYSYAYYNNNYGSYGYLGDYGYAGSRGSLGGLGGGSWGAVLGGGGLGGPDMLAADGAQDRHGPGLDPLLALDSVSPPLGATGGGVSVMMCVPTGLGALVDGGPADLGDLSAGAPAMVNPGDLGALGASMPMMTGAAGVGGIITGLQDALRGAATGVRPIA